MQFCALAIKRVISPTFYTDGAMWLSRLMLIGLIVVDLWLIIGFVPPIY